MNTSTFTLSAGQLKELLQPVHFASTDPMLPVLCTVVLEAHGKHVRAMATNRFVFGVARVEPREAPDPFRAQLRADDAKQIISTFKTGAAITVEVDGDSLTVSAPEAPTLAFALSKHEGWPYEGSMRILREATASADTGTFSASVDPKLLVLLQKVASVHRAQTVKLRLGATPRKPIVGTIGDDFFALVMPRGADVGSTLPHPELDSWHIDFEAAS